VLEKARKLCRIAGAEKKLVSRLEKSGWWRIHPENLARKRVRAGCEWIVTGSAIFHSSNMRSPTREMREMASQATAVRAGWKRRAESDRPAAKIAGESER